MRYLVPPFLFTALIAVVLAVVSESNVRADDPPAKKAITEKEGLEFGRKLEDAIVKRDKTAIDKLIRIMDLCERAVADLELPPKERDGIVSGAKNKKDAFAEQILNETKKGGRYTMLRTRVVDGERRVLMRLITSEGSVNYHDIILHRAADGQVAAEDLYIFMSGEMLSNTFRRLLFNLMSNANDVANKLKGADQLYLKNALSITKMSQAVKSGRGKEALEIYRKLPADLQKDKSLMLMAIVAAQNGDEDEYIAELERFRKAFPNDAAIDFISIDYYILKKQFAQAEKAVERVDKTVGGDPFLQVLKAGILSQSGKNAQAKAIVEKAIEEDPKLLLGYQIRVSIALEEKNHVDTLTWLKKTVESGLAEIDAAEIKANDDYAAFIKSPEFEKLKTWLAERKK